LARDDFIRGISQQLRDVDHRGLDVVQASKPEPRIMRYELADFEWAAIRSFLPNKPRGIPRVDDRRVLNGIFWVLRSVRLSEKMPSIRSSP
jgi:hypothetical protein